MLIFFLLIFTLVAFADPQTSLVNKVCGYYPAADTAVFSSNLNAAVADLRSHLSTSGFATAQQLRSPNPVFALAQCRDYLASSDCLVCLDAAATEVRSCGQVTDGFVVLDGCSLRYNNNNFFDEVTLPGDVSLSAGFCGHNQSASAADAATFNSTVAGVLSLIVEETPMKSYEAVAARMSEGLPVVYGVGQCVLTVSSDGCKQCLKLAYTNIEKCPPASDARAVDLACFLRYSDRNFFNSSGVVELEQLLNPGRSKNRRRKVIGWAGGGGGAIVVVAAVGLIWWCRRRRKRRGTVIVGATEQGRGSFDYHNLKNATMNFSDTNKLGEGGFAAVYKGVLKNGEIVAVKRLAISETSRARTNFESEVTLISNVYHKNLLRLLGCCRKGPELLLVYEYMEKGSLHSYLFGEKRGTLSWEQRFDVVLGTARGLAYLHEYSTGMIIHRDVKPANILLDRELQPKLGDFGLAKLLPDGLSHMSTRLAGTIGYTAPEYVVNGQLSEKADVYSFGVVVLEIVSGQRSNSLSIESLSSFFILEWAWMLYETESLLELVDKQLRDIFEEEVVRRTIVVALMCTQTVQRRPSMTQVVNMLLEKDGVYKKTIALGLVRPTFLTKHEINTLISESGGMSSSRQMSSNATVSNSQFLGR